MPSALSAMPLNSPPLTPLPPPADFLSPLSPIALGFFCVARNESPAHNQ
jgi:hypothetical protein